MIERNCIKPNVVFKALYTSHHNENKEKRTWVEESVAGDISDGRISI